MPSDGYVVRFTRHAEKDLRGLQAWENDVLRHIRQLEDNPHTGHTLVGTLKGCRSLAFNLKGSGAFRSVYYVLSEDRVRIVFLIASHENVYREAERRVAALRKAGGIA